MFQVTADQVEVLSSVAQEKFAERLRAHLQDRVPEFFADLSDEECDRAVESLIARARDCRMRKSDHIRRYAIVDASARGHANSDAPAWFTEIINGRPASASIRLIQLEDALIHLGRDDDGLFL